MMRSSKTRNYHICDILYSLFEDNIFQNNKEIKFISISVSSLIKGTANFGHCTELIYAALKSNHIASLKKKLDKAELKPFFHDIDEKCLINILEYQNIKRDTKKTHKSNYMVLGDRVQTHKYKLKNKTNANTFRNTHKPGTPEGHRSITSHFNAINKCDKKVTKQGEVYYYKQTDSVKNPYKKN